MEHQDVHTGIESSTKITDLIVLGISISQFPAYGRHDDLPQGCYGGFSPVSTGSILEIKSGSDGLIKRYLTI